jgi:hypothetical protein
MILPYYPDPKYIKESIKEPVSGRLPCYTGQISKIKELVISLRLWIRFVKRSLH